MGLAAAGRAAAGGALSISIFRSSILGADGVGAAACLPSPYGLALASSGPLSGLLLLADTGSGTLRTINPASGAVSTLAAAPPLLVPAAVALNAAGTIAYVTEGAPANALVAVNLSSGAVTVLAPAAGGAALAAPAGLVLTPAGTALIANAGDNGIVSAALPTATPPPAVPSSSYPPVIGGGSAPGFADGFSTSARFSSPAGAVLDPANGALLLIADTGNDAIRLVNLTSGLVITLAGNGVVGAANGEGSAASFSAPSAVAVDPISVSALSTPGFSALVYVADTGNNLIRVLNVTALAGGGFAVIAATLAGGGAAGFTAAGSASGVGSAATFFAPTNIVASGGMLYVSDACTGLIRAVHEATGVVTTVAGGACPAGAVSFTDTCAGAGAAATIPGATSCLVGPGSITVGSSGLLYVLSPATGAITIVNASSSTTRSLAGVNPAAAVTPTASPSASPSTSCTASASISASATLSLSRSASLSASASLSGSSSSTPSLSRSSSRSLSNSASATPSATATRSPASATAASTAAATASASLTVVASIAALASALPAGVSADPTLSLVSASLEIAGVSLAFVSSASMSSTTACVISNIVALAQNQPQALVSAALAGSVDVSQISLVFSAWRSTSRRQLALRAAAALQPPRPPPRRLQPAAEACGGLNATSVATSSVSLTVTIGFPAGLIDLILSQGTLASGAAPTRGGLLSLIAGLLQQVTQSGSACTAAFVAAVANCTGVPPTITTVVSVSSLGGAAPAASGSPAAAGHSQLGLGLGLGLAALVGLLVLTACFLGGSCVRSQSKQYRLRHSGQDSSRSPA